MMAARGRFLPINHGADSANAQRCRKYTPGGMCIPCKAVYAACLREWRRTNTEAREANRMQNRARGRAFTRLAQAHPGEFRQLLNEEMQRERRREVA